MLILNKIEVLIGIIVDYSLLILDNIELLITTVADYSLLIFKYFLDAFLIFIGASTIINILGISFLLLLINSDSISAFIDGFGD